MLINWRNFKPSVGCTFFTFVAETLCFALYLPAQQMVQSTIRGTATDPSAAPVPNLAITLINLGTGGTRSAMTNQDGDYEITDLLRGTYRLTARASGFNTFVADDIILESSQIRRIDIPLVLGATQTVVTVQAHGAVINTESGDVTTSYTYKRYDEIPLVASRFDPTLSLTGMAGVSAPGGGNSLLINGQQGFQLFEGMDGQWNDNTINAMSNTEDVNEIKVFTSVPPAEYARAGGFNMTYKSGSNQFHGRVYDRTTNSALGARDFFAPSVGKQIISANGVQASGPIKRDKLFFYGAFNFERFPSNIFFHSNVPSARMRSGDFSQLLAQGKTINDPLTGLPFSGNMIPPASLNTLSLNVQNTYIPSPNSGGPDTFSNNFVWNFHRIRNNTYLTERMDYQISNKNTLFGRWVNRWQRTNPQGSLPEFGWTRKGQFWALILSDTYTFSPRSVNAFRFGWIRNSLLDGGPIGSFSPLEGGTVVSKLGLLDVNPQGLNVQGFPAMSIAGFSPLSVVPGGPRRDRDLSYADTVSQSIGKHVMKFGGELITHSDFNNHDPTGTFGNFTFNGAFTGFSYADFILGLPFSSSLINPVANRTLTASELGFFWEDTFKITHRFNIDFGLRWDYFGSPRYQDGKMYNWNPATGAVIVPQSEMNAVSAAYPSDIQLVAGDVVAHADRTNFRPRVGVTYRLTDNQVIRGGYGQYTETLQNFDGQFSTYNLIQGGGPFQVEQDFINSITNGVPLFAFPHAAPGILGTVPAQSVSGYPLDVHNGVIHEFNVSFERQFHDTGLRISYIGARDHGLNYFLNINEPAPSLTPFTTARRPFQQFVSTSVLRSNGQTKYDSLQVEGQRKIGHLTFDAHWTWAQNFSNFLDLENPYSPSFWNHDDATPHQRVVVNLAYELPFGRGQRFIASAPGAVEKVVGGWRLYYMAYLETGQFFSPAFSGSDPSNTNTFGGLPDRLCNGNYAPGSRALTNWFDAACFAVPPAGRFGNSGVNILEGPGYNAHHLAVIKTFKLRERLNLQWQLSISNLFNHPNFIAPNSDISFPGTVGRIFSTVDTDQQGGGARQMEMKLRFDW